MSAILGKSNQRESNSSGHTRRSFAIARQILSGLNQLLILLASQQHHDLQNAVKTSSHTTSSEDKSRQCGISFGSHHRDTDQWLSDFMSPYRHHSGPCSAQSENAFTIYRSKRSQTRFLLLWFRSCPDDIDMQIWPAFQKIYLSTKHELCSSGNSKLSYDK